MVITTAGTHGPVTGKKTINTDVIIKKDNVRLKNMIIKGDLIIDKEVGDGEVYLDGVTVEGQTLVRGGGENSVFFKDSVLATVIVNKNNGAVRIVAQGDTEVYEVQLDTPAKVVEEGLTGAAEGFTDIVVSEAMQANTYGVQLLGEFETINVRARNIKLHLSDETDIRQLILNVASQVLGTGNIRLAEINANGSTLSMRPQNLVLNTSQVEIKNEIIDESYSSEDTAELLAVRVTPGTIAVDISHFLANLNTSDFEVQATVDNQPVALQNLRFNSKGNRFDYMPLPVQQFAGKQVKIKVTPKNNIGGAPITASYTVGTGFGGKITDIQNVGMANATLTFKNAQGQVAGTTVTDRNGYYAIQLPPGVYQGEISGAGYITSPIIATAATDVFLMDQNETGIRAAAIDEIKIMLDWGEKPRDLDSHLTGPVQDGERFHVYYADKVHQHDDIQYVDLDWDDTNSYGPETTVIRKFVDGEYHFFVYNYYSHDDRITESDARVRVYLGNSVTPDYEFTVPKEDSDDLYWSVFKLKVSDNGQTKEIIPVNKIVPVAEKNLSNVPIQLRSGSSIVTATYEDIEYFPMSASSNIVVLESPVGYKLTYEYWVPEENRWQVNNNYMGEEFHLPVDTLLKVKVTHIESNQSSIRQFYTVPVASDRDQLLFSSQLNEQLLQKLPLANDTVGKEVDLKPAVSLKAVDSTTVDYTK